VIILLQSSKTMRSPRPLGVVPRTLLLGAKAQRLGLYVASLPVAKIARIMGVSRLLAEKVADNAAAWSMSPEKQSLAIDSFIGDIYSGLRAGELSAADREYADQVLCILSGQYGALRPFDGICPYRVEMAYRFPEREFSDMYAYWGEAVRDVIPEGTVVNLTSLEYGRTVVPFLDPARVVTPKFLSLDPKTGKPTAVAVHAKIARGAFARWLITSRITDPARFSEFSDLGYSFDQSSSQPGVPVFICREFGGKGLSIRLR